MFHFFVEFESLAIEHVTFVPKGMSSEQLQEGFEWLNFSFLSWGLQYLQKLESNDPLSLKAL